MILNYFKLALRVMLRRKFFTFISLFGISFTLMVLMLIVSYLNSQFASTPPLTNVNELVIVPNIQLKKEYFDTIPKYDTTVVDGLTKIDTSFDVKSAGQSNSTSDLSRRVIEDYLMNLSSSKTISYASNGNNFDLYRNNQKVSISVSYIGPNYFEILDYKILEGRLLNENDNLQSKHVIVITHKLADKLFGKSQKVIGQSIEFDNKDFEIVGVVETPKPQNRLFRQNVFACESLFKEGTDNFYFGNCFYIAKGPVDLIKKDILFAATKIPFQDPEQYNELILTPMSYKELFASNFDFSEDPTKAFNILKYILMGIIGFFTLLPLLNLVNLNVSRIMDRSSEIGVRKAFGATDNHILYQYIFENVIQTLLGGVIGLVMALVAIYYINTSGLLNDMELSVSPTFFFYSLLATLFFGLLSGAMPAYIISKSHIVTSLKSKQL
ncbi:MAG: ABC transporter permease [Saprospiraceae bacterium]|nr:ABC transporter permease [Saprospiraceae bacterium]